MRLDKLATEHYETRARAKEAIEKGLVLVNGKPASKPALDIKESDTVEYLPDSHDFVSRSGFKLQGAFDQSDLNIEGETVLDIGASTGGFTQCCLEHGAAKVYALDVGHLQLSDKLKNDERVISMEGVNARDITADLFEESIDFICMDVSFISAITVLEAVFKQFVPKHCAILIKPQFECTPSALKANGVIKHPKYIALANEKVKAFLSQYYGQVRLIECPITGKKGNQETIALCEKRREIDD